MVTAVGLLAGFAAGPWSEPSPLEHVREGNAAFARDDLAAADRSFAQAQEKANDPGLVAFNAAAVRMVREEYRDAELHYLRVLDDREAPLERRAKALNNRGVCILHRADDAATLRIAIACFEECIALRSRNDELNEFAPHRNLEVAKLLWSKARAKQADPPRANDPPPEEEPPPEKPQSNGTKEGTDNGSTAAAKPTTVGATMPNSREPQPTNQKAPGTGNLPVLLDSERPQQLPPEDTRAVLDRINKRLANDRRANARMLNGPERLNVRDW